MENGGLIKMIRRPNISVQDQLTNPNSNSSLVYIPSLQNFTKKTGSGGKSRLSIE